MGLGKTREGVGQRRETEEVHRTGRGDLALFRPQGPSCSEMGGRPRYTPHKRGNQERTWSSP